MNRLIMMSGLPASGKSTVAKQLQKEFPNSIRVNKDLLREMLYFNDWNWRNEEQVRFWEEVITEQALSEGKDVIVDDTNLTNYHKNLWETIAKKQNALFIEAKQNTDWKTCIARDLVREKSVGEHVIKNFAMSLGQVDRDFVICDLDGTLCDITDRRHFVSGKDNKSWEKFFANIPGDKVRYDVAKTISRLGRSGYAIVYLSGRPEEYKQQTIDWLKKHNLDFNFTLIMRKKGDKRDDVIVKREMLNKYFPDRNKIYYVFDDRPKVVRMWKEELGEDRIIDVGDGVEF